MGVCVFCAGTFERSLDGKERILLPKSLRLFLGGGDCLFLTPGTDGCLEIHNETSLRALAKAYENSDAGYPCKTIFSRIFLAQSQRCEIDSHQRIRVAGRLIELVSLVSPVVIVGVGSHWEIWNQPTWNDFLLANQSSFDRHAASVRSGGEVSVLADTSHTNKPR